jgi:hypothetical protein
VPGRVTSFVVSQWSVEMEPEVEEWLESLPPVLFAVAASRVDYLADAGASIRSLDPVRSETASSNSGSIWAVLLNGSASTSRAIVGLSC